MADAPAKTGRMGTRLGAAAKGLRAPGPPLWMYFVMLAVLASQVAIVNFQSALVREANQTVRAAQSLVLKTLRACPGKRT